MGDSEKIGAILLLLVASIGWTQAHNCTTCDKSRCPPIFSPCCGSTAIDPCGCCEQCARQNLEPCGGPNGVVGYCDREYECMAIIGHHKEEIPNIGVCKKKSLGDGERDLFEDEEDCPKQTYCYMEVNLQMGYWCDCVTRPTCVLDFYSFNTECILYNNKWSSKASPKECSRHGCDVVDNECVCTDKACIHVFHYNDEVTCNKSLRSPKASCKACSRHGCDVVDNECVCTEKACNHTFQYKDGVACNKALVERLCANVTCSDPDALQCPPDSVKTKPYTVPGKCCPTVPSYCTCNYHRCHESCPSGRRKVVVQKSEDVPGRCCSKFRCLL